MWKLSKCHVLSKSNPEADQDKESRKKVSIYLQVNVNGYIYPGGVAGSGGELMGVNRWIQWGSGILRRPGGNGVNDPGE